MFQLQLNHSLVKVRGNNNATLTAKLPPSGVFKKALNCFLYCKQKQRGKISTKQRKSHLGTIQPNHINGQLLSFTYHKTDNSIKPTKCSEMIHHPNHPEHLIENKWRKMNWIEIPLLRKETSLFKKTCPPICRIQMASSNFAPFDIWHQQQSQ